MKYLPVFRQNYYASKMNCLVKLYVYSCISSPAVFFAQDFQLGLEIYFFVAVCVVLLRIFFFFFREIFRLYFILNTQI